MFKIYFLTSAYLLLASQPPLLAQTEGKDVRVLDIEINPLPISPTMIWWGQNHKWGGLGFNVNLSPSIKAFAQVAMMRTGSINLGKEIKEYNTPDPDQEECPYECGEYSGMVAGATGMGRLGFRYFLSPKSKPNPSGLFFQTGIGYLEETSYWAYISADDLQSGLYKFDLFRTDLNLGGGYRIQFNDRMYLRWGISFDVTLYRNTKQRKLAGDTPENVALRNGLDTASVRPNGELAFGWSF